MAFRFTEDQILLAEALGEIAARHWTSDDRSARWAGDMEGENNLRRELAEAGVLGLSASEAAGGMGMGLVDLMPCLEMAGRHCLPDWVARHLLNLPLLESCTDGAAAASTGESIIGLCVEGDLQPDCDQIDVLLRFTAAGLETCQNYQGENLETVDAGRPLRRLDPAGSGRLIAEGEAALELRKTAFNLAVLGDCLQLLGLAQAAMDMSVAYAKERQQFGKPIGAQQAVKHQLADALIALEFARPMVWRAGYAQHHKQDQTDGRCSAAWLLATQAARRVERAVLQVHGAMGYSFEYPLHHLLKRSWALRRNHGNKGQHRARAEAWILENDHV